MVSVITCGIHDLSCHVVLPEVSLPPSTQDADVIAVVSDGAVVEQVRKCGVWEYVGGSVGYVNCEFVTVHGAPIRRMGLVPANQQALG